MKRVALEPTFDNLLSTLNSNKVNKQKDILDFILLLKDIEGSFNIALDGGWGIGKTFFIKQTKLLMDYFSGQYKEDYDESEQKQIDSVIGSLEIYNSVKTADWRTVYFDAWEHDNNVDPIASLAYELALAGNGIDTEGFSVAGAINSLLRCKENLDLTGIITREELIEDVKKEKNIKRSIEKKIDDIIGEVSERIIVFVDELDRCNPNFAIRLLERIKHYFNHEKIIFVFALNAEQLQYTIKAYYGEGFQAIGYLDKLFDLWLPMPEIKYDNYLEDIKVEIDGKTGIIAREVMRHLQLSFREMEKYMQSVKNIYEKIEKNTKRKNPTDEYVYRDICLFLLGLKIKDITLYHKVMEGKSPESIIDFFFSDRMKEVRVELFEYQNDSDLEEGIKHLYDLVFNNNLLELDKLSYEWVGIHRARLNNAKNKLEECLRYF